MDSWLYSIVPASKPKIYSPLIVTWALFGNDEDGICGERSLVETFKGGPVNLAQFLRWTFRNPFHNLFFHVLAWPGGPFFKWGSVPGWNGYLGFRPPKGVFGAAFRYETSV